MVQANTYASNVYEPPNSNLVYLPTPLYLSFPIPVQGRAEVLLRWWQDEKICAPNELVFCFTNTIQY